MRNLRLFAPITNIMKPAHRTPRPLSHLWPLQSLQTAFLRTAGLILALTGVAKVFSAFGNAALLRVLDPVLAVPFRHLMLGVGLAELVIAGVCFFGRRPQLATMLVAWLASSFVVYRLGLGWLDWSLPCGCLGQMADRLPLSPETQDRILKGLLAFLFVGSYALLLAPGALTRNRSSP